MISPLRIASCGAAPPCSGATNTSHRGYSASTIEPYVVGTSPGYDRQTQPGARSVCSRYLPARRRTLACIAALPWLPASRMYELANLDILTADHFSGTRPPFQDLLDNAVMTQTHLNFLLPKNFPTVTTDAIYILQNDYLSYITSAA